MIIDKSNEIFIGINLCEIFKIYRLINLNDFLSILLSIFEHYDVQISFNKNRTNCIIL
jgi:hypothetical protein